MSLVPNRFDLPGLLLALKAIEGSANPMEAIRELAVQAAAAPEPSTVAWLVEFDTLIGETFVPERHLVFDEPTGPYLDCATALTNYPWRESKPLNWDYTS